MVQQSCPDSEREEPPNAVKPGSSPTSPVSSSKKPVQWDEDKSHPYREGYFGSFIPNTHPLCLIKYAMERTASGMRSATMTGHGRK